MAAAKPNSAEHSNIGAVNDAWLNHVNICRSVFMCNRCKEALTSSEALGGHQNAHRRVSIEERVLRALEDDLILYPNGHGSQVQQQNQIIDHFWCAEKTMRKYEYYHLKHISDLIPNPAEVQDDDDDDELLAFSNEVEGEDWMEKGPLLPELNLMTDEKGEASSSSMEAINGAPIDDLDLTLKL